MQYDEAYESDSSTGTTSFDTDFPFEPLHEESRVTKHTKAGIARVPSIKKQILELKVLPLLREHGWTFTEKQFIPPGVDVTLSEISKGVDYFVTLKSFWSYIKDKGSENELYKWISLFHDKTMTIIEDDRRLNYRDKNYTADAKECANVIILRALQQIPELPKLERQVIPTNTDTVPTKTKLPIIEASRRVPRGSFPGSSLADVKRKMKLDVSDANNEIYCEECLYDSCSDVIHVKGTKQFLSGTRVLIQEEVRKRIKASLITYQEPTSMEDKKQESTDKLRSLSSAMNYNHWLSFGDKFKNFCRIEFPSLDIQKTKSLLYKEHKELYGGKCDENCVCIRNLEALCSEVRKELSEEEKCFSPGFSTFFVPKYLSKAEKTFPKKSLAEIFDTLQSKWRSHSNYHGHKCHHKCRCESTYGPIFHGSPAAVTIIPRITKKSSNSENSNSSLLASTIISVTSTAHKNSVPRSTHGTDSQAKNESTSNYDLFQKTKKKQVPVEFTILYDTSKPLGLYCYTDTKENTCIVYSVDPNAQKSFSSLTAGTVILSVLVQTQSRTVGKRRPEEIHSHSQLKEIYESAKEKSLELKLFFRNSRTLQKDEGLWSKSGWAGSVGQGWAGGALEVKKDTNSLVIESTTGDKVVKRVSFIDERLLESVKQCSKWITEGSDILYKQTKDQIYTEMTKRAENGTFWDCYKALVNGYRANYPDDMEWKNLLNQVKGKGVDNELKRKLIKVYRDAEDVILKSMRSTDTPTHVLSLNILNLKGLNLSEEDHDSNSIGFYVDCVHTSQFDAERAIKSGKDYGSEKIEGRNTFNWDNSWHQHRFELRHFDESETSCTLRLKLVLFKGDGKNGKIVKKVLIGSANADKGTIKQLTSQKSVKETAVELVDDSRKNTGIVLTVRLKLVKLRDECIFNLEKSINDIDRLSRDVREKLNEKICLTEFCEKDSRHYSLLDAAVKVHSSKLVQELLSFGWDASKIGTALITAAKIFNNMENCENSEDIEAIKEIYLLLEKKNNETLSSHRNTVCIVNKSMNGILRKPRYVRSVSRVNEGIMEDNIVVKKSLISSPQRKKRSNVLEKANIEKKSSSIEKANIKKKSPSGDDNLLERKIMQDNLSMNSSVVAKTAPSKQNGHVQSNTFAGNNVTTEDEPTISKNGRKRRRRSDYSKLWADDLPSCQKTWACDNHELCSSFKPGVPGSCRWETECEYIHLYASPFGVKERKSPPSVDEIKTLYSKIRRVSFDVEDIKVMEVEKGGKTWFTASYKCPAENILYVPHGGVKSDRSSEGVHWFKSREDAERNLLEVLLTSLEEEQIRLSEGNRMKNFAFDVTQTKNNYNKRQKVDDSHQLF